MKEKLHQQSEPNLWRSFLLNKLYIGLLAFSVVLMLTVNLFYAHFNDFIVFPNTNAIKYSAFTDKANKGTSEITNYFISDSVVRIDFDINEGYFNPYVGLSIAHKNDSVFNFYPYNELWIEIKANGIDKIGLYVYTKNNMKQYSTLQELCFFQSFKITNQKERYCINLSAFKIPDWFIEMNNIKKEDVGLLSLRDILYINVTTANAFEQKNSGYISLYSMLLKRNNAGLLLWSLIIVLAFYILLFVLHYLLFKAAKPHNEITVTYKAITVENETHESSGFLDYISSNFHHCDLTLEQVSKVTGINQRRIANHIQDAFACNFKRYVNQIRINESKRLLKESEMNMGEIAFAVGFNSQSHFNRVFKGFESISPSEFRKI